jgi:hypothetical protein
MRQQLREAHLKRVVGFGDAVADLGTHRICGTDAPYSRQMVYAVLYGKSASPRLMARIVEKRPDLLDLSFVAETTRERARALGWLPREKRMRRGFGPAGLSPACSGRESRRDCDAGETAGAAMTCREQDRAGAAMTRSEQDRAGAAMSCRAETEEER